MKNSERIALYEWCVKNKFKSGAEKIVTCTQMDYLAIRASLRRRYKYADYQIIENNRDEKTIRVYIK